MERNIQYNYQKKHRILTMLMIFVSIIYISPLIVTFTNSFMSSSEVRKNYSILGDILHPGEKFIDMNLIPIKVTLSQYMELLVKSPIYLNMFWNSIKLVVPMVIGQIVIASMAAYAFRVLKFKGKEVLFYIYIIVMLLPLQVTLMPNYLMADWLNITDRYIAIILPGIFHPFGVFLLRQSMNMIPDAYFEASKVDGAGHIRIFISIVVPMVKSGIAATTILTLIDHWNLIDQAVIFIQDNEKQPLSIFLANLNSQEIGSAFAGACFYAFPVLLILFFGQDYLKDGIQLSGVKG